MFRGQTDEAPVPASIKVDVSGVARNVASMSRLLRAGFDLHFTNHGRICWMVNGGLTKTISEDSPTSGAPLYSLDDEVLPPLGEFFKWRNCSWCEGRSHRCGRRTLGRRQQSGVGGTRARHGSEWSKRHLHGSSSRWREMADRIAGGQTSQREDVKHQTCW